MSEHKINKYMCRFFEAAVELHTPNNMYTQPKIEVLIILLAISMCVLAVPHKKIYHWGREEGARDSGENRKNKLKKYILRVAIYIRISCWRITCFSKLETNSTLIEIQTVHFSYFSISMLSML